jgi:hypothetical protein
MLLVVSRLKRPEYKPNADIPRAKDTASAKMFSSKVAEYVTLKEGNAQAKWVGKCKLNK